MYIFVYTLVQVLHKLLDLNILTCLDLKSLYNNFCTFFFTFIGSIILANTSVAVQKNTNDANLNLVSTRAKYTTIFTTTLWLADFGRVCIPRFLHAWPATEMSALVSQCPISILYVFTGVLFLLFFESL